jgi:CubicO group peptidase (beta-lactamase class C family)
MANVAVMDFGVFLRFTPIILICAALSGCASLARDSGVVSLEQLAIRHRVCSVAVVIIRNRQLQSLETASGCQAEMIPKRDTVFEVASLSKPVFAYAVLKLVEQGKLALDAPIAKYLPAGYAQQSPFFASPNDGHVGAKLGAITVRIALNHTSGLPNLDQRKPTLQGKPGEQWLYSGWGYLMLQKAVEAVTQQPLEKFMAASVFEPLGMTQSSYIFEPRFAPNFAVARSADTERIQRPPLKEAVSAYSLHTSADDYSRFVLAVLNDAALLKKITDDAVSVDTQLNLTWGLGWGIEQHANGTILWHWGNNPGYRAFVIASTQSGDGLIMLTNSTNGLALAEPLTKRALPGEYKIFSFI